MAEQVAKATLTAPERIHRPASGAPTASSILVGGRAQGKHRPVSNCPDDRSIGVKGKVDDLSSGRHRACRRRVGHIRDGARPADLNRRMSFPTPGSRSRKTASASIRPADGAWGAQSMLLTADQSDNAPRVAVDGR
jgi:hypothetical protein